MGYTNNTKIKANNGRAKPNARARDRIKDCANLRFSGVPSAATRGVVVSDIFYPKIEKGAR
jgi:hypothetical protein